MKNASTEINAFALSRNFSQLCEVLYAPGAHKSQSLATIFARHPQLRAESHEVEALYDDLLLAEVAKYTGVNAKGEPVDFLQCLNQALKLRSLTLRAKVAARNALTSSIDAVGDAKLSERAQSAEDVFMEREIVEDYLRTVDADPAIGPRQAAVIRHRIENGLSCNEIVNLAPGVFRNRQQMWRAERRAGAAWRGGSNA